MENEARCGVGNVDRVRPFQGDVDALIADQADFFGAADDRLDRRSGREIVEAVLEAMFRE